MRSHSRFISAYLLMSVIIIITPAGAWARSAINTNWRGIAIKGYDPVAYFTMGQPQKGQKAFEYQWQGAKWRFANQKHMDLFKANPTKYAPQYGSY